MKLTFGLITLGLILLVNHGSGLEEALKPISWWPKNYLSSSSCQRIRQWGLCRWGAYYWLCRSTCWWSPWCKSHGGGKMVAGRSELVAGRQGKEELGKCRTESGGAPQLADEATAQTGIKIPMESERRADEANLLPAMSENRQIFWWWDYLSRKSCWLIRRWGLCRWGPYFWLCGRTCRWSPWCIRHGASKGSCQTEPNAPLSPDEDGVNITDSFTE